MKGHNYGDIPCKKCGKLHVGGFRKGNIPWNMGLRGIFHHSQETKQKMSESKIGSKNPNYGKPAWSRGLTKEIDERIFKGFSGEKNPMYGKHHTKEEKRKVSEKLKGKRIRGHPAWNRGIPRSEERHQELILKHAENFKKQGYKIFLADGPRPDLIISKEGKIYAVEIETNKYPNTEKYNGIAFFDDIYWIIEKGKEKGGR